MSGFCARREMPSLVSDALASRAGSAVSSSQKFPPAARQATAAVRRVPRRETGVDRAKDVSPKLILSASLCWQQPNTALKFRLRAENPAID